MHGKADLELNIIQYAIGTEAKTELIYPQKITHKTIASVPF
jgi:hypothetical protein